MTIIVSTIGTNSSRDYEWLKQSVADWLHRTDLTSLLPDFVMLAEKRINTTLKAQSQGASVTLSASAGNAAVSLPDDIAEIRAVSVSGRGRVSYLTSVQFAERYASGAAGVPVHYTISGSVLKLGPTPDGDYSLDLDYVAKVPALADSAGTNWLIEKNADVYLAATMCEALIYTKDREALAVWEQKYQAGMDALNSREWGAAGPLVVRPESTTP